MVSRLCSDVPTGGVERQEAYDRSGGRILCVSVCPTTKGEETFLLNHLSAPHCVVWSAIAASCAFPGMFPPQTLLSKNRQGQLSTWKVREQRRQGLPPEI